MIFFLECLPFAEPNAFVTSTMNNDRCEIKGAPLFNIKRGFEFCIIGVSFIL